MRPALAVLVLLCMAMAPPVPTVKHAHQSAAVHQGRAALDQIAKPKLIVLMAPMTNTFSWKFAPGTNPSNYWWSVEASSDLANWSVVVSNASGPGEVQVKRTDPPGFFRLAGRSSP